MSKEFPFLHESETIGQMHRHLERELDMDYTVVHLRDRESRSIINGTLMLFIRGAMPHTMKLGRPFRVVAGCAELITSASDGAEQHKTLPADATQTIVPEGTVAFVRRLGDEQLVLRLGQ